MMPGSYLSKGEAICCWLFFILPLYILGGVFIWRMLKDNGFL
jgi:hypothetical protein